ncbi:copper binding protein, plastocyanin/azurin family [Candidatus Nitrosarchaeum limnium BG20]|uniref:Copper binding protein, plastocyanin/azurin family n=2 Tax=Nitrosarchaeum TaxID=1007082 RepID=S2EUG6_9ARCH|nr:copper binding protein, plastocyanin/azurin family [Candidatus Nitrosarchaeum limnium BG20]
MMPGMGLTAIGVTGVTISYAGIAHTFVDGMHALTGLTMFIGLIFLSAGILDGGVSTSNRAKATTLVILSIGLSFGTFALTMNSSNYTITLAGLLMAVAFPSIIISYLAMKMPQYAKPVGAIVALASATGIIMWFAFGFVSPDTYMINEPVVEEVKEEMISTAPVFTISILKDSAIQGNPDYEPDVAHVPKGDVIEWINEDTVPHTVTSSVDFGDTFNSNMMNAGEKYTLDTSKLASGEYEYMCMVHPWMVATLIIEEPKGEVKVMIPQGSGTQKEGQLYYDPTTITVPVGTPVVWDNVDNVVHTVTSGKDATPDGTFDSGLIDAGKTFKFTFSSPGKVDYFCMVHPWMVGSVEVE